MIEYCEKTVVCEPDGSLDFEKHAFGFLEYFCETEGTLHIAVGECLKEGKIDRSPGNSCYFYETTIPCVTPGEWRRVIFPEHVSPAHNIGKIKQMPPAEAGGEIAPFRYVEVSGSAGSVKVRRGAVYPQWNEEASCFESDNAALDRVWEFCKYSMKATAAFGLFVDGERERLPYEGDVYINQLGYFCCDADYSIARKTIDSFQLQPTWPTEWQLLTPILARDYLFYSGDYDSVKSWLEWLPRCLLDETEDADGFIGKKEGGDIVDWPMRERDGYELAERNSVPNCYRYAALKAMFDLTGKQEYLLRAERLRKNVRQKFYRGGFWRDNLVSEHYSLHGAVFAQCFGLTDEGEYGAVKDYILSRGMSCSVFGAQFLLEALGTLRDADAMLRYLTASGSRSWLGMMEQGATISMEAWSNEAKPNQDWTHAWGAAPANIIPRFIAGIRPVKAGFAEFILDPQPGYLQKFYCRKPTPHGAVEVEYFQGKGMIVIPPGTSVLFRGRKLLSGKQDFSL